TDAASGANSVWYGDQTFFPAPITQPLPNVPVGFQVVKVGDFDRDGKTDVIWFNTDTGDALQWLMRGQGNAPVVNDLGTNGSDCFIPPDPPGGNRPPPTAPTPSILWRHHDDFNYLWQMTPDLSAVIGLPGVVGANWTVVGRGDLNGDGFPDMVWYETT